VIDNLKDLLKLKTEIQNLEYVAYDCETTGLKASDEVIGFSVCGDESIAYYVITAKWDVINQKLVYIDYKGEVQNVLNLLKTKQLVCHNGVFDCKMAEAYFKVCLIDSLHTDTMVLAHLLNENRRIGLKELAKEYFGPSSVDEQKDMLESIKANGGQVTKANYELYKGSPELIAKYGAKDAWLTYKLFLELVPELYAQGLDKFFYEDESMPLLRGPTYELNTTGLQVDNTAVMKLKKTLEAECAEHKAYIFSEIAPWIKDKYPGTTKKNQFNLGSNQQMAWLLFGQLKLEFSYLTDGGKTLCHELGLKIPYTKYAKQGFIDTVIGGAGKPYKPEYLHNGKLVKAKKLKEPWSYIAVDKETLKKLAPKYKWIATLLEYNAKNKLLNTYVEALETLPEYGILHPSFRQTGTTSGRYSSNSPNLQNLPRDNQGVKECIVARPGKVFVSADYSQLEPRIFSYYSKDERLMSAFTNGSDFYSVVGIPVYGKYDALPLKEGHPEAFGVKYKKLRDLSKVIALASAYGATAAQLMRTTGKSMEDTAEDINNYFEAFPGVKTMMTDAHAIAKETGQVTNLFGRPRRMPQAKLIPPKIPHESLPYDQRNILNLAVNHRIQSTGASLCNRSMIKFYSNVRELGLDAKIVSQVHDEIIVECPESDADTVAILLEDAMINTNILPGVPLEAVPRVTKTLAK
jgi:DNA polymerase I-like protein with 3'-5' exonuclease and polymerase domains